MIPFILTQANDNDLTLRPYMMVSFAKPHERCRNYLWLVDAQRNPNKTHQVHGRVVRLWSSDYALAAQCQDDGESTSILKTGSAILIDSAFCWFHLYQMENDYGVFLFVSTGSFSIVSTMPHEKSPIPTGPLGSKAPREVFRPRLRSCVLPPSSYFTMAFRELTRDETVWEGFSEEKLKENPWVVGHGWPVDGMIIACDVPTLDPKQWWDLPDAINRKSMVYTILFLVLGLFVMGFAIHYQSWSSAWKHFTAENGFRRWMPISRVSRHRSCSRERLGIWATTCNLDPWKVWRLKRFWFQPSVSGLWEHVNLLCLPFRLNIFSVFDSHIWRCCNHVKCFFLEGCLVKETII